MKQIRLNSGVLALLVFAGCMGSLFLPSWSLGEKGYQNISVDQFVETMKNKDFVLINVHIPYEGEIPGTDLFVPYNAIDQYKEELPQQKDAKIVVYCRTGRMGDIAAGKLADMGYTRVLHFQDGMRGWEESGRSLLFRSK
jgi:rhodanese-related sulfurtransferase